jgi:transposase
MKRRSAGLARASAAGGAAGKGLGVGIVKRNGLVKAQPIEARDRVSVLQVIEAQSREGSLHYTDQWQAYATLRMRGEHVIIGKQKGRPVGRDHINGIEGFWSYAKNWLYPYRGVPRKYFPLYLGEICYRFNHRDEDIKPLLINMLKTISARELEPILVQSR